MWLPIAAGLGSALAGMFGSNRAASAQTDAANSQLQLGREQMQMAQGIYDQQREDAGNALAQMIAAAQAATGTARQAITGGFQAQQGNAQQMRDAALGIAGRTRDSAVNVARQTMQQQIAGFQPYAQTGGRANNALAFELGLGARPAGYRGFQETPGFQFARDQGTRAIEGSAAARGGLLSGATLREAANFNTGLANQFHGQFLDRLTGQQGMGLAAQGAIAGARGQFADRATNAANNYGNMATGARNNFGAMMAGAIGDRTQGLVGAGNNQANALMAALSQWANGGAAAGNNFMGNVGGATSNMANALANLGDARAAGAIGGMNALTTGIGDGLGLWSYLQNLNKPAASGAAPTGMSYGPR